MTALIDDLEKHFPHSKCHYDYVMTAEALYNYDSFAKLLFTMRHFCQSGTKLIWAVQVRYPPDLVFIEDFRAAFHASKLAELNGVKIYLATHKATDSEGNPISTGEETEKCHTVWNFTEEEKSTRQKTQNSKDYSIIINTEQDDQAVIHHQKVKEEQEEYTGENEKEKRRSGKWEESQVYSESESFSIGKMDQF